MGWRAVEQVAITQICVSDRAGGVETEGCVALFEQAGALEHSVAGFELFLLAMFSDDHGAWGEECGGFAAKKVEDGGVFVGCVVGGVYEGHFVGFWFWTGFRGGMQECRDGSGVNAKALGDAETIEIGAKYFQRWRGTLNEDNARGSAAEGLNADGA